MLRDGVHKDLSLEQGGSVRKYTPHKRSTQAARRGITARGLLRWGVMRDAGRSCTRGGPRPPLGLFKSLWLDFQPFSVSLCTQC